MDDLTGHLLVAMPAMGDPRFTRSVIFVCAHSADGAMGLVINRPSEDMRLIHLAEHLEVEMGDARDLPVHMGGPVEPGRGFVLHSTDWAGEISTVPAGEGFSLTATRDAIEALAVGGGPRRAIAALGYAGWGEGQIEGELAQNAWLTVPADPDLVFGPDARKWDAALGALGVDPRLLSAASGTA